MKNKERDTLDDLFRSKLQDFEVDTMPGDWDAISGRLPGKAPVSFRRSLRYWAAAAVISLLMITGGVYIQNQDKQSRPVAERISVETATIESRLAEQATGAATPVEQLPANNSAPVSAAVVKSSGFPKKEIALRMRTIEIQSEGALSEDPNAGIEVNVAITADTIIQEKQEKATIEEKVGLNTNQSHSLIADATPAIKKEKKKPTRKWGFGMGGGSITAGTANSLNTYAFKNTLLQSSELMSLNSPYFDAQAPKTNINHKTPVAIGLGVSRYLNNRFSLQTGLNYSFLSSEWETNGKYSSETKQKLHFIGIPLSLSYKIAEWKRMQFYAAAGGMAEVNVGGKLNTKIYSGKDEFRHERDRIRMKEWLWSVNARVGASYPLLSFLSLYAEAGVGYYFDNGSVIETIHSDKPFNVNLQAGFRFGF